MIFKLLTNFFFLHNNNEMFFPFLSTNIFKLLLSVLFSLFNLILSLEIKGLSCISI